MKNLATATDTETFDTSDTETYEDKVSDAIMGVMDPPQTTEE